MNTPANRLILVTTLAATLAALCLAQPDCAGVDTLSEAATALFV